MSEGLIKDSYELIIKEVQSVIAIGYMVMVGIGMLFNYQKYDQFKINIFDYADVFDFLVAPFADYRIFVFAFVSITLPYALFKLDGIIRNNFPAFYSVSNFGLDKLHWFKHFRIILFTLIFVAYLFLSAFTYGKYVKLKILKQDEVSIKYVDNKIQTGIFIGKTKDVVFLLNKKNVMVIPLNSTVKEMILSNPLKH